jgi:hypothetical protein
VPSPYYASVGNWLGNYEVGQAGVTSSYVIKFIWGGIHKKVGPALKHSVKDIERSEQIKARNNLLGHWLIGFLGLKVVE